MGINSIIDKVQNKEKANNSQENSNNREDKENDDNNNENNQHSTNHNFASSSDENSNNINDENDLGIDVYVKIVMVKFLNLQIQLFLWMIIRIKYGKFFEKKNRKS